MYSIILASGKVYLFKRLFQSGYIVFFSQLLRNIVLKLAACKFKRIPYKARKLITAYAGRRSVGRLENTALQIAFYRKVGIYRRQSAASVFNIAFYAIFLVLHKRIDYVRLIKPSKSYVFSSRTALPLYVITRLRRIFPLSGAVILYAEHSLAAFVYIVGALIVFIKIIS